MAINVLKANSNPHNLPNAFQEVEWIKSNDNAYINPNINITADIGFKLTANIPSDINGTLIGNYLPGNYFFFVYAYNNGNTTFFPSKNASTVSITVARNVKTTFSFKNGVLDDGTTQTTVSTYATAEIGQPLYLFSGRPNNWFTSYTLYECEFYNGSNVVNKLIPCYRKVDGEIGVYDIITNNFYSNANSVGYFTKGNAVVGYDVQKLKVNILTDNVRLPAEYEEVEYLQSSGTQYIDTGIKPNSNTTYNLSGIFTQLAGTARMGSRNAQQVNECVINSVNGNQLRISYGNQQILTNKTGNVMNVLLDGYNKTAIFTYEDSSTQVVSLNTQTFSTDYNCYIFAYNNGTNNIVMATDMIVYSCKIYDNNVLVRKFIPCYRKSDNVAGMYDMQNNQFYTNAGTGTFSVGNDIPKYKIQPVKMNILKETLPTEYQKVEYIESTGTQYIDTGVNSNIISKVEVVASNSRPDNVSQYNPLFGRYTSDNSSLQLIENYQTQVIGVRFRTNSTLIPEDNDWHTFVCSNEFVQIDENKQILAINNVTDESTMVLFARRKDNSGEGLQQIGYWRCKNCKIFNNDTLIRNFVPCYRKSDNVIGLYDTVNGVFYTNAGTGTFSKGSDVPNYQIIKT